jgi:hypothetical protein
MDIKDHSKAAYLFSIANIAQLIKSLSANEEKTLSDKITNKDVQDVFVQYVAMAHNGPVDARK